MDPSFPGKNSVTDECEVFLREFCMEPHLPPLAPSRLTLLGPARLRSWFWFRFWFWFWFRDEREAARADFRVPGGRDSCDSRHQHARLTRTHSRDTRDAVALRVRAHLSAGSARLGSVRPGTDSPV